MGHQGIFADSEEGREKEMMLIKTVWKHIPACICAMLLGGLIALAFVAVLFVVTGGQ